MNHVRGVSGREAGPLQDHLDAPGVTDVLVNGVEGVWLDRGAGCERVEIDLGDAEAVRALAVRLASVAGRRLDDAQPTVDAQLPSGARLHAVLPPLARPGPLISIRVVRNDPFRIEDLVASGMVPPALARTLAGLVRERASILVTGATGSGKTTLLATLLSRVDPRERIVIVEEAGELAPRHPHVVRLIARGANVEGVGEVGVGRLVKEALRMRPDRLVLGECRGAEVQDVLLSANTGHRGTMTTMHANSAADVPARLAALGSIAGLSERAVAMHAATAFDVVIHLTRATAGRLDGPRRIGEVALLVRRTRGLAVEVAARCASDGTVAPGPAAERLAAFARVSLDV